MGIIDLENKIVKEGYNPLAAARIAAELYALPPEFKENIREWMEGKEIEDREFCGISIHKLMKQHEKFGITYTFIQSAEFAFWKLREIGVAA